MKLSTLGETGFINRIAPKFHHLIKPGQLGIGDDCAVIPRSADHAAVFSTDMLIEDVHFSRHHISPNELGHKALAVNLSDIAAMGAQPESTFLSLGLPTDVQTQWIDRFLDGFHQLAEKFNVPLLGGDTTRSQKKMVINVAVSGIVAYQNIRLRNMAKRGDTLCVTGFLGDAAGGRQSLVHNIPLCDAINHLIHRQNVPSPHLNEGAWLAKQAGVHAMMDLSRGIASDLPHILQQSHKAAQIELSRLPISPQLEHAARQYRWEPHELALHGGEDYTLLVTIAHEQYNTVSSGFLDKFGYPLHMIGCITAGEPKITYFSHGKKSKVDGKPFARFR